MAVKTTSILCAVVFLVQSVHSACLSSLGTPFKYAGCGFNNFAAPALVYEGFPGLAYEGLAGYGCGTGVASTGGGLTCASTSPFAPAGISVLSENVYEGSLAASGNLPFLGTIGIEGILPTAGVGAVSYGCGDGAYLIGAEGPIATGITVPGAIFPPGSPSTIATADALAMVPGAGYGLGYNGLNAGFGYGLANPAGINTFNGFGLGGCGFGAIL